MFMNEKEKSMYIIANITFPSTVGFVNLQGFENCWILELKVDS